MTRNPKTAVPDLSGPCPADQKGATSKTYCPEWASEQIHHLRQIEIFLGHIPSSEGWKSDHLSNLSKHQLASEYPGLSDDTSMMLFRRIVTKLRDEGFPASVISEFINARCGYTGGPKYCNEEEVNEALD